MAVLQFGDFTLEVEQINTKACAPAEAEAQNGIRSAPDQPLEEQILHNFVPPPTPSTSDDASQTVITTSEVSAADAATPVYAEPEDVHPDNDSVQATCMVNTYLRLVRNSKVLTDEQRPIALAIAGKQGYNECSAKQNKRDMPSEVADHVLANFERRPYVLDTFTDEICLQKLSLTEFTYDCTEEVRMKLGLPYYPVLFHVWNNRLYIEAGRFATTSMMQLAQDVSYKRMQELVDYWLPVKIQRDQAYAARRAERAQAKASKGQAQAKPCGSKKQQPFQRPKPTEISMSEFIAAAHRPGADSRRGR